MFDIKGTSTSKGPSETALRGGIWTTVSRVLVQVIQFGIFMVAVRVMRPEEFGIFALVAALILFLNQMATAGWSEYILHWKGAEDRLRQTLFLALVAGLVGSALGVSLSFLAHVFSDDPVVAWLARVLSASVVFTAVGATYSGVLIWQGRISVSAICILTGEMANFAVAVTSLLQGQGIMALAYGRLAGAIVICGASMAASHLRPVVTTQLSLIAEIAVFSWNIMATRLLVTLRSYAATLMIGGFMGPAAVGIYRAGQRVVGAFEEILSEPARILAWSHFRKFHTTATPDQGFDGAARRYFPMLIYCAVPLFTGIAVMADDLIRGMLGADWTAAVPVVQVLAIAAYIRASSSASTPILSLVGKVGLLPRYVLLYSLISIACISVGAVFGVIATALSEVIAAVIVFVINARVMRIHADVRWPAILAGCWPVLPAVLAALPVPYLLIGTGPVAHLHPLVRFVGLGLCMLAVYAPVIAICDRSLRSAIGRKIRSLAG